MTRVLETIGEAHPFSSPMEFIPPNPNASAPVGLLGNAKLTIAEFEDWIAALPPGCLIPSHGGLVSDVQERAVPGDNSASSAFFGYHFDGAYLAQPPDICALYCVDPGRGHTPTAFLDSAALVDALISRGYTRETLQAVNWTYQDRWGVVIATPLVVKDERSDGLLLRCSIGYGRLLWRRNLKSASADTLVALEQAIIDSAAEARPLFHHWRPGELVWWDNKRLLHARIAKSVDPVRHLKRAWLKLNCAGEIPTN